MSTPLLATEVTASSPAGKQPEALGGPRAAPVLPAIAGAALARRPLWQSFLVFFVPLLVTNILQSLSGTVNNVYLGQMIGVKALATVSAFSPVLFFCIAFAIGLGAGASVLIGQAWGARQPDTAREVAGSTLALGLLIGLVLAGLGYAFAGSVLRVLGTPPDILADATRVARIVLVAMPGLFLFILSATMLRGVGDTLSALFMLLISTAIGLMLTPALIRGWLGLPRMGVASATWAGVVSYALALIWLAWRLWRIDSPLKLDLRLLRHLRLKPRLLGKVLRVGVPASVQSIVVAVAELALLTLVNAHGSDATAAYGAVNQVIAYVQFPAISITITTAILGAQVIGAGRADQLGAIVRTAQVINLLFTGTLAVLGYLLARQIMGFFITSESVLATAQTLLHIMLWSLVVFGMAGVFSGIMRASGTVLAPMLISIGCIALVELPTAWIASHYMGLSGVWLSYPAAFCAMLLLQWGYYRFVWRRRAIVRMV